MPTEAQLKAQMQAAIAKKKAAAATKPAAPISGASKPVEPPKPEPIPEPAPIVEEKPKLVPTSTAAIAAPQTIIDPNQGEPSEAELTRTFFGRPIRVAISHKQVFFAVPDVLEIADIPDKQTKYLELKNNPATKKLIDPLVKGVMFPSPNGGNEKLDAAQAKDMVTIIQKLQLPFPGPIGRWLVETADALIVLIT